MHMYAVVSKRGPKPSESLLNGTTLDDVASTVSKTSGAGTACCLLSHLELATAGTPPARAQVR